MRTGEPAARCQPGAQAKKGTAHSQDTQPRAAFPHHDFRTYFAQPEALAAYIEQRSLPCHPQEADRAS